MYETMVKEAYENILGMDKEAGILDNAKAEIGAARFVGGALKDSFNANPGGTVKSLGQGLANHAMSRPLGTAATAAGAGLAAYGAKKLMDRGRENREENGIRPFSPVSKMLFGRKKQEQPMGTTITINGPMGKRAAAYYDEAQLVKQAAEADYAEACAYEEAALQILDELGYLD